MKRRQDRCRKPYNVCASTARTRKPEYMDEKIWKRECLVTDLKNWVECPSSSATRAETQSAP